MLLLLIWRHLEYYAQPRYMNALPVKVSVSNAMRLLATAEPEAFRADMGARLAPALERLVSLDLVRSTSVVGILVNNIYFRM